VIAHQLADLSILDHYKSVPFPPGYDKNVRRFYAPVDDVHGVELFNVRAVQRSYDLAMFGFDDEEKADAIEKLMADPNIHVRLTLDGLQAKGAHERLLLAREKYSNNSMAIGGSEHGRIMHMKLEIIDGVILVTGSTNLSMAAETLQDNELTVRYAPIECIEARMRIDAIHSHMLDVAAKR
jgi:hypothetical protein